jgi:hypothetical protein
VPGQLSADLKERVLTTIKAGLRKEAKDLQELEGCMLLAEQMYYAGQQLVSNAPMPTGVDMWQPIFASSGGFPRLLYIPGARLLRDPTDNLCFKGITFAL